MHCLKSEAAEISYKQKQKHSLILHIRNCHKRFMFSFIFPKSIGDNNCTPQKKPVTTMLTYPWKCTVLHCNHLGNTWKPLVLMTRHFDYCPSASEGDNQSVRSSAPVVSRCFPGGYNVKLYISRGRLAWWFLAFSHSVESVFSGVTVFMQNLEEYYSLKDTHQYS